LPENLLESELFGYEKGAFTGAAGRRVGKFELADGGTLFLDEVSSLKPDLQRKLLRVLQEREIERIGGLKAVKVDIRIIAATNVDLKREMIRGNFREDLYYRLNVVPIFVPPLRDRRDDIPLLVDHFLEKYNRAFNRNIRGLSKGAYAVLQHYHWPGNVRELENLIERIVATSQSDSILLKDLPLDLAMIGREMFDEDGFEGLTLQAAKQKFEREFITRVLDHVNWNQSYAARVLGIHRNTLLLKLGSLKIKRTDRTLANKKEKKERKERRETHEVKSIDETLSISS
ncbi:MAG: sigma-54-dependent Fis family transcriptional regulator, partial [Candidatus Tectomicrobia bacterium]|nr:sigma-54-dependent Fis family transcriptional regulator [Candidatus Tectomicrobia bacterium]